MKNTARFSGILLLAVGMMTTYAGAAQTFSSAAQTYATKMNESIIFSAQSGSFGVTLVNVNTSQGPQEGGMEVYSYSASCACWNMIGSGGGVVNNAPDLKSFFGIDSADATILATKLKSFLATP